LYECWCQEDKEFLIQPTYGNWNRLCKWMWHCNRRRWSQCMDNAR